MTHMRFLIQATYDVPLIGFQGWEEYIWAERNMLQGFNFHKIGIV